MSTMINIGPMIAKITRDMLDEQGTILDVESVYARMINHYGDQIFESERMLAQVAVKAKIKSHLKNAHSINGDDEGDQLKLLKDDAPATLAVKQDGGGYAYIPLRMASVADLDAATKSKKDNIKNAKAALRRWERSIKPIRGIMIEQKISFPEAQKLAADQAESETEKRKRKA